MAETAIGGHFNGFGTGGYTGDNGVSWSFGGEKELMLLLYIVFQVLQWPLIIPVKDMLEQMLASMDCCIYS
ncbi:hypothetical protein EG352_11535 [Chryseobacterium indologenes]|uniref:Uncharacterized protein n=1 Tax=Chryseobacterium indologenes TaxID=253 RepID=A0AAD0YWR6_CHRID|nr:hypothetical protein [Chryseobacterium indologenes]AZB18366.1 hypothetical protein EG352_11535 [Chryseobacterium indologenes]